jgi:hypothetical protein
MAASGRRPRRLGVIARLSTIASSPYSNNSRLFLLALGPLRSPTGPLCPEEIDSRSGFSASSALDPGVFGRLLLPLHPLTSGCRRSRDQAGGQAEPPVFRARGARVRSRGPAEDTGARTVSDRHANNAAPRAHERQSCPPPRQHMSQTGRTRHVLGGAPNPSRTPARIRARPPALRLDPRG